MNIKNGCILNNYKLIVITTTQRIDSIYPKNHEDETQWIRRLNIIDKYEDDNDESSSVEEMTFSDDDEEFTKPTEKPAGHRAYKNKFKI